MNLFINVYHPRERREHRVFKQLLQSIPGLEERLVKGSEEDIVLVADVVFTLSQQHITDLILDRSSGVQLMRDPMTPKA